jgi:RTX calcium-binding nonapeptide repeat (4 copies)
MDTNPHTHPATRRRGLAAGAAAALTFGLAAGMAGLAGPAGASTRTSASVSNDTLTVTGSRASDSLALRLASGDPNTLEVDFGDDGTAEHSFDRSTFSSIDVFLRSGHDRFRVDQVNGAFADEELTVDGGTGNDVLDGGDGVEQLYGGSGRDAVDGNRGNDTGDLGSGHDSFRWDPGDGSDVVEGRSGTDTLDFNGAAAAENMRLSPNGRRSLFFRDVGNISMDMDDVERLDLAALAGVDTVTVEDMSGTDLRHALVDLSGPAGGGDGEADTVTVNGTNRRDNVDVEADDGVVEIDGLRPSVDIAGSETSDRLQVNTLGGNDDVDVDDAALGLIDVTVDLGTGQH